jgi:hypothetical protein
MACQSEGIRHGPPSGRVAAGLKRRHLRYYVLQDRLIQSISPIEKESAKLPSYPK